ncbi:MAG: hypothetical protein ACE5I7_11480 [Candidatus Binatia bacterium]
MVETDGPSSAVTGNAAHRYVSQLLVSLDRRTLLKTSLRAATALTLAPLLPGCTASPPRAERFDKLRFFSKEEGYVLERFTARMLPPHPGRPTVEDVELIVRLDEEINWLQTNIDARLGSDLKHLLQLVEYGPFLIGFKFRPFTRLADAAQDDFLQRWARHRFATLRMAFRNLRALCVFFYLCDDRTWNSMRYAGPWLSGGAATLRAWQRAAS